MSSLRKQQSKFTTMVALLILFANQRGYELTFSDAYATSGHVEGSFHYKRLAVDFNLFEDNTYLTDTSDYVELGRFWESLGGTWGGRWDDGCHFSLGE